jgi:hypothetical protein
MPLPHIRFNAFKCLYANRRAAPVPEAVVSVITRQLLLGLLHCHEVRGSIHR